MKNFDELIKSDKLVLVDFYAEWCGPCKYMMPILDSINSELSTKVSIVKIDIDKHSELADKYIIKMVPTFMLFKNGKNVWRESGIVPEKELKEIILKHI